MVQDTLLLIIASAASGALATGIVTLFVREFREKRQRKRMEVRLRKSLIAEIEEGLNILGETENPNSASGDMVPAAAYESASGKIGLLSPSEAEAAIKYYSRVNQVNALGVRISSLSSEEASSGVTHHVSLDSWQRARSEAIPAASNAIDALKEEDS